MAKTKNEELVLVLKSLAEKADCTQRAVAAFDKKLDLHIQKTEFELDGIKSMDAVQNDLLDKHIEGVNTLKKMYEAHELADAERFKKLEEPRIVRSYLIKGILVLGSIATAIAGFAKLFRWF